MSSKVTGAIAVLVVLTGLVIWQFNAEDAADQRAPSASVTLPKIERDAVDKLTITTPTHGTVELAKSGDTWNITSPLEFPAAQTTVDTVLDKLSELTAAGVAATRAENHAQLEVDDEHALKVVASAGGTPVADLRIGVYRSGNTMVRVAGEDEVASVNGSIRFAFDKPLKEWRNRDVTKFETEKVQRATFESDKGTVVLDRDGETFKQAEGQTPIEEFDPVKAKSVVGSACTLRAVDFVASPDLEALGLGEAPKAKVTLEVGGEAPEKVVILIGNKDENYYYAKRADSDVVYTVSNFMGERLSSGPDDFVKEDPKPIDKDKLEAAGAQFGPEGQNALPPEVMEQVKRQLAAQGVHPQ